MLYAVNGGCSLYASGRKFPLIGPRMAFLTGPFSYQLTEASPGLTLSSVDLVLKPGECFHWGCREMENAYQQLSSLILPSGRCEAFCDSGATVTAALQNLLSFSVSDSPQREAQLTLAACFLLAATAALLREESSGLRPCTKPVRAALAYIHENYMRNITTRDVAAAAGVHVGHLHRIFPAETGQRIGEYLTNLRVDKAKSLLMRTDLPSSRVAALSGVNSLPYFSRLFKQKTGMTPLEFRRSYAVTKTRGTWPRITMICPPSAEKESH
ncbi:MAG: helix-turn-helix domain-containing protein [Lachnospiraceae bacterium]